MKIMGKVQEQDVCINVWGSLRKIMIFPVDLKMIILKLKNNLFLNAFNK